jgi:sporulation protein YlmC with PRC-barrel domain
MASEEIRQRSDLLNTLVVTRDTGKKLGVVSQLWVDIDQRQVVALSLRPNILYGTPQPMLLDSIRQIGDVILVDNEDVIEDLDVETYTTLIGCEVITETGELLGKVRGYKFDIDSGNLTSIIVASVGMPLIPDQVVSTYELSIDEVVSSGPDRLIVFEGSEERLVQLSVGVLERVGLGKAPWERDEEEDYVAPIRADNQLPSGVRTPVSTPIRQREPERETWDADNWEQEPRQLRQQQRRAEPLYYDDDDSENWSEASSSDRYSDTYEEKYDRYEEPYDAQYEDLDEDVWKEQEQKAYIPPPVNIPEKQKAPEYEEEGY